MWPNESNRAYLTRVRITDLEMSAREALERAGLNPDALPESLPEELQRAAEQLSRVREWRWLTDPSPEAAEASALAVALMAGAESQLFNNFHRRPLERDAGRKARTDRGARRGGGQRAAAKKQRHAIVRPIALKLRRQHPKQSLSWLAARVCKALDQTLAPNDSADWPPAVSTLRRDLREIFGSPTEDS